MYIKGKKNFSIGDLVVLRVINRSVTDDGLTTIGSHALPGHAVLYETIDLRVYPSCNDFFGSSAVLEDGVQGIIIDKIGRPESIIQTKNWNQYDVYAVLFEGYTCHVFGYNLEHINEG
jgi:hypothetical protein